MARELTNWLDAYLEYTDNTESPLSYHQWCGLSILAGALQRRVYLKWGISEVLYPNLYLILVGPSGRTRKGTALGISKDLLKQIPGITIAPESSSGREAMIQVMKKAVTNFEDPTDEENSIKFHCATTAFSEELSVFLGQGNISYLSNLTDWYDSKDDWEYETIGRGKDSLHGLCLNLMGGTAPDWLQSMIPAEAVGGGFTSRVIFIVETEKRKIVPEHTVTEREKELKKSLLHDLELVSKMAGEMQMTSEAKAKYVAWYIEQDKLLSSGNPAIDDPRFAGYCERRATHIRKLMLVCSAARSDDLTITGADFDRALSLLLSVERNMHRTFGGFGRSRNSESVEIIKNYIEKFGTTTRKLVLRKFWRDIDADALTQVEKTLEGSGYIHIKNLFKEQDKIYTWIGGEQKDSPD